MGPPACLKLAEAQASLAQHQVSRTPTPSIMKLSLGSAHARGRRFTAVLLSATLALPAFAQTVQENSTISPATDEKKVPVEKATTDSSAKPLGETVELSPFQVTSNAKGYFQSNTMSGTRLNSKIEDIAQPITVMTKEQMRDFAMLDINDVFDYMASTEGTNSYSEFVTDRTGAVVDNTSLSPNTANRVRGIGSANIAFNNIAMTGRIPVDPLWLDSIEVSRGPNANIFGLGNASGTVNQVPATANLNRDFSRAEVRGDSYGGWRTSLDVNRVLLANKLSVRASYAYQHTGFIREPSGENADRLSFQLKYQPFKNTTISASWYNYKNASVRPNYTTPRDYFTDWIKAGKPMWNAATGLVTFADGRVYGNGNVLGSTTPYTTAPSFVGVAGVPVNFTFAAAESRSPFQIGAPGQPIGWLMPRYTSGTLATSDPFGATATGLGFLTTGSADTYTATQQPLYNSVTRPINDKSIYDWTSINLAGNSKAWDDDDVYLFQLDQVLLNTSRQTLAAQVTYMRENSHRVENQPMGPASVNSNVGQLQPDVNQVYLDGTTNPYAGRPYLRSSEPFLRVLPKLWDTARAQAVYRLDFSQDKGWTKWLGTQQLLGYYEYKDQKNRSYTYRHVALGKDKAWEQKYASTLLALQTVTNTDPRYLINGTSIVPGNFDRLNEQYYVGNTVGGGIQYAPNYFPEGVSVPYVWGPNSTSMIKDVSAVGWAPGQGGGLNNLNEVVKTTGGVLQSMFLEGRLVGTFGKREDLVNDRNAPLALMTSDLTDYDFAASNRWNHYAGAWRLAQGKTTSTSIVARPLQDLKFLRPGLESGSGVKRFLAQVANSLSLSYNQSDNFIAQGPAYDLFLHQLPNQTGTSKDIGFTITPLDGKLSIRYTHFDTKQLNLRNGDISTMAQRVLRYEGFIQNDGYNLRTQSTAWLNGLGTGGSATNQQIADAIHMSIDQYNGLATIAGNGTYAAVMDSQSKGHEVEINFNPTANWTVSATVTKTQAINTAAGSAVDDYIAARMPIWTTIEDPRFTQSGYTIGGVFTPYPNGPVNLPTGATGHLLWWNIANISGTVFNSVAGYNSTQSPAQNFAANVDAPMAVFRALIGRPLPQQREYSAKFTTRYNLAGISDNKILKNMSVGGSLRYSSKGAIGFYGLGYTPGMDLTLPANKILALDPNRPIYSKSEYYVDLFAAYKVKLFADKVRATFQFNVKNLQENGGRLQPTAAFFDGRPSTYRIVDPRQFILSVSFDL